MKPKSRPISGDLIEGQGAMAVTVKAFGAGARLYRLKAHGRMAEMSDFGAALVSLHHPDGKNVVLGLPDGEAYRNDGHSMGIIAGRHANRIAGGRFALDGQTWSLPLNDGRNHLHGGEAGFGRRLWRGEAAGDGTGVNFRLTSPHLDEGYPGALEVTVSYRFTPAGTLRIGLHAEAGRPALVNLAPHGYFNLTDGGKAADHLLRLHASAYTPADAELIPTGEIVRVAGVLDYRTPKPFGPDLDLNFVVDGQAGTLRPVAEISDPLSGRRMRVRATAPGVQVYGGGALGGGGAYEAHAGFCIEPQYFPDSPNQAAFTTPLARPGQPYEEFVEIELV